MRKSAKRPGERDRPPVILVAPDSFKGTYPAPKVAAAIARGARAAGAEARELPLADGGEGTLDVVLAARGGEERTVQVSDPLGRAVSARFALLGPAADGVVEALVESAQAIGLALLAPHERDPWSATSRGVGELIVAAARSGAQRIMVAVGGSATVDGGEGAIEAIEGAGGLGAAELVVLCDVDTEWERCAEVYGPQKGADPATVERLAERLGRLAERLPRDPRGVPGGGAAGGLAGGLWAQYDARLVAGAERVLAIVGFERELEQADALVLGEGRLDRQTLEGKIAARAAVRAAGAGVPIFAVVGRDELGPHAAALGLELVLEAGDPEAFERAGAAIAERVLAGPGPERAPVSQPPR
jgi:glycerate kinase